MTTSARRLIEVDLPIRRISEHARKDQNIRKGHLHTMHVWWATRPLASCRAVMLAAFLPDPADPQCPPSFQRIARDLMADWALEHAAAAEPESLPRLVKIQKNTALLENPEELRAVLLDFIADFAAWDAGVDRRYVDTARKLVAAAHPEGQPLVMDPFAGAGSIPFEALRLGAGSFAGDLNPVAVLLNKVSQEYLPKYGRRLAEGVETWGDWLLKQARRKLAPYYPEDGDGNNPLAYIWARTITCEGPGCGAEVPLLGMLWLSRKTKNQVALRYRGDRATKSVGVELFRPRSPRELQQPIVQRMAATCPCCGYTTPYKSVREQLRRKRGGTRDARLIAVITLDRHGSRHFRLPERDDLKAAQEAGRELERIEKAYSDSWSFVPHEPTPPDGTLGYRINKYGMEEWSDAYLPRQALALGTFCELVGDAREDVLKKSLDSGFADAVATCLGLAVTNTAPISSAVSWCDKNGMRTAFMGSGLPMKADFAEANPLMPRLVGGVEYSLGLIQDFLRRESESIPTQGNAQRASATEIPLPDDSVHYLVTDPPYYDAVPYAALSDFCYVWLKRAVGSFHPDLFASELAPKAQECILDPGPPADGGPNKDRKYFETTMQAALADARRALKPGGLGVIIFAHKGTAGWEALLNALVKARWTVTASWPIDTERAARMRARDSAVLGSSVHLVCRPLECPDGSSGGEAVGDWREVLAELPKRIHEWMPRLSKEGIVGADAIFACLGPALEVFSRYSRVEKASGEEVSLRDYLEYVWAVVSQEALRLVFEGVDATGFEEDARLTAMWLWTLTAANERVVGESAEEETEAEEGEPGTAGAKTRGGYVLEFDTARKIAQGLGAHLENLASVVEVKGDTARLLPVQERTKKLFGKDQGGEVFGGRRRGKQLQLGFEELVEQAEAAGRWGEAGGPHVGETTLDRVHQSMLLFAAGRSEALRRFVVEQGTGRDARFWTLAQALSALYPSSSAEKRWIDGVLARKRSLGF